MTLSKHLATFLLAASPLMAVQAAEPKLGFDNAALEEIRALCTSPHPSQKLDEMKATVADMCRKNKATFEILHPDRNYFAPPAKKANPSSMV